MLPTPIIRPWSVDQASELSLVSLQRVIERMSSSYSPGLICHGDRQDADSFVVRQNERSCASRHIEGVSKKIRIGVRLSAAIGGAALRSEPGDVRSLDEARPQTNHLAIRISARSRGSSCRRRRRALALRDGFFRGLPDSIVPLPNEASPILDRQLRGLITNPEGAFLVTTHGCGEQIHTIVVSGRQLESRVAASPQATPFPVALPGC